MSRPSSSSTSSRSSKKSKGKKWEPLVLPPTQLLDSTSPELLHEMFLPQGFSVRFFPHDMRHMYTAPSKHIHITRGVIDYIREYNQLGPNKTKTKLFLCSMFERSSCCENGFMCREVHCRLKVSAAKLRSLVAPQPTNDKVQDEVTNPLEGNEAATSSLSGSTTVLNLEDEDEMICNAVHMRSAAEDAHPRLSSGVTFRLALPNMQSPIDEIPSECIFVTKGSREYYDQVIRGDVPTMNMQHCAHFSKNGMCCFGADCQFVHVAQYRARTNHPGGETDSSAFDSGSERDENSRSQSSLSSRSSSSSSLKAPKSKRNSMSTKETPLSLFEAPVDPPHQNMGGSLGGLSDMQQFSSQQPQQPLFQFIGSPPTVLAPSPSQQQQTVLIASPQQQSQGPVLPFTTVQSPQQFQQIQMPLNQGQAVLFNSTGGAPPAYVPLPAQQLASQQVPTPSELLLRQQLQSLGLGPSGQIQQQNALSTTPPQYYAQQPQQSQQPVWVSQGPNGQPVYVIMQPQQSMGHTQQQNQPMFMLPQQQPQQQQQASHQHHYFAQGNTQSSTQQQLQYMNPQTIPAAAAGAFQQQFQQQQQFGLVNGPTVSFPQQQQQQQQMANVQVTQQSILLRQPVSHSSQFPQQQQQSQPAVGYFPQQPSNHF